MTVTKRSVTVAPTRTEEACLNPKYYIDLTDKELQDISVGRSRLVFHGFFRYLDIFGRWHDTGFGVAYTGALMPNETCFMSWIQREGFNWFD